VNIDVTIDAGQERISPDDITTMGIAPAQTTHRLTVRPFDDAHVGDIIAWVETPSDLRWLAPSTDWPLTPTKIHAWHRDGGKAFGLHLDGDALPIGYGELNPMRANPEQLWIGHVIISPAYQRRGFGRRFVTTLSRVAFDDLRAEKLILVVFPANTPALQCYRRAGFRVMGEEFHVIGNATGGDAKKRHRLIRLELTPSDLRG
jgi:RimJ/RimL family protein N-acetyltransferase